MTTAGGAAAEFRRSVAAAVAAALRDDLEVRAVGEGGAAARRRADEYSDLDLMIVAPLEHADTVFEIVERVLTSVAAITHRWIVEPVAGTGMAQRFYFLANAPRFFAVDCSVLTTAGIASFLEPERHGEMIVWFDRDGVLEPRALDAEALSKRQDQRLEQLRGAVPVFSMLVDKELARGHALEALGFYQVLLKALIELLGMKHRRERFDFAWRYIDSELPSQAQSTIAHHAFVANGDAIKRLSASLVDEIRALLDELSAGRAVGEISGAARDDPPSPSPP